MSRIALTGARIFDGEAWHEDAALVLAVPVTLNTLFKGGVAISIAGWRLGRLGALPLLIGFVFVVGVLDLIMTGAIPKWAIFAPIFVPLLMRLNVEPEAVLAAYRVGDSPINSVTPLNAYFALIVSFAMKYQKDAGVGTVIALMLPYVVALFVAWPVLLAIWQIFGLPWGF